MNHPNTRSRTFRTKRIGVFVLAAVTCLTVTTVRRAPALTRTAKARIEPAVVQVGPIYTYVDPTTKKSRTASFPWGSGTFISENGLILTSAWNADIAGAKDYYHDKGMELVDDILLVSVFKSADAAPVPAFIASVVATGTGTALLQVTSTLDGKAVDTDRGGFPWVGLGDSDAVDPTDTISVFGYPDPSDQESTVALSVLTAKPGKFYDSGKGVKRAYLDTDVQFPVGFEGGAAVNDDGLLIGLPAVTQAAADPTVPCKPVSDTNGDGVINSKDACPPPEQDYTTLTTSSAAMLVIQKYFDSFDDPAPDPTPQPAPAPSPSIPPTPSTKPPTTTPTPNLPSPNLPTLPSPDRNAKDVAIVAKITDSSTGRPIAGAWFFVLKPGQVWGSKTVTQSQVLFALQSDQNGEVHDPSLRLARGATYAVGADAAGHYSVTTDTFKVPVSGSDPLTVQIALDPS